MPGRGAVPAAENEGDLLVRASSRDRTYRMRDDPHGWAALAHVGTRRPDGRESTWYGDTSLACLSGTVSHELRFYAVRRNSCLLLRPVRRRAFAVAVETDACGVRRSDIFPLFDARAGDQCVPVGVPGHHGAVGRARIAG